MSDYVIVNGHSPRQLAEAVVCAVLDASEDLKGVDRSTRTLRLADEVIDVLLQHGVRFAPIKPAS
ncbi:MAG: hypothetical protein WC876_11705 [Candidatus Thermoplasmatota archaeon]|jgi:hypothetical protein